MFLNLDPMEWCCKRDLGSWEPDLRVFNFRKFGYFSVRIPEFLILAIRGPAAMSDEQWVSSKKLHALKKQIRRSFGNEKKDGKKSGFTLT